MKMGALIVGILGFAFAAFTALYVRTGFTGPSLLGPAGHGASFYYMSTIIVAVLGLIGALLVFWAPRTGALLAGIATVAGGFTSGTLWLGAGSFFLVVTALAYSVGRSKDEPTGGK